MAKRATGSQTSHLRKAVTVVRKLKQPPLKDLPLVFITSNANRMRNKKSWT